MQPVIKNAEATRARILAAATAEFSSHGIAGARVDAIARAARANKNLIYVYFGNKDSLFDTVLKHQLERVHQTVPLDPGALPDYAGRIFDFCVDNPEVLRLMYWSTLERKGTPPERTASLAAKAKAIAGQQAEGVVGREFSPEFLLTATLLLASAWTGVEPFGMVSDPQASAHLPVIREAIVRAVTLLCQA